MNKKIKWYLLSFLLVADIAYSAPQQGVTAAGSPNASRLVDGDTGDTQPWQGLGPQLLRFRFDSARNIAVVRLHPGKRAYAKMPSTEGGPREISIQCLLKGQTVGMPLETALPRDHQQPQDFMVDVPLPQSMFCDEILIHLITTHDGGCRVHSPNKPVVPENERSYYLREVVFITAEEVSAEQERQNRLRQEVLQLLADYDNLIKQNSLKSNVLQKLYDTRFKQLRQYLDQKNETETLQKELAWLKAQAVPWFKTEISTSQSNAKLELQLEVLSGTTGEVAVFPLHFSLLEELAKQKVSKFNVEVLALKGNVRQRLASRLEPLSPERVRLSWALVAETSSYIIQCQPATENDQPRLDGLVGDGDVLKQGRFVTQELPSNFWSVRMDNLFGDAAPALIAGRWTDFAHIYRNFGKPGQFRFLEAGHYLARDPWDVLVGTDEHHGLAFSIVESCDADGDGKRDLFMSRYYNTPPFFLHGQGTGATLDYAAPVMVKTLSRGTRYAYGDLDGDGIADALGIRLSGANVVLCHCKGLGLNSEGVPVFDKEQLLEHALPPSTAVDRGSTARTPSIFIGDLNRDGLLDCSVMVPPNLYVSFNEGTSNAFSFKKMQQVMTDRGESFSSTYYYPNFGWADVNGDGIPDLFRRTANTFWPAIGSVLTLNTKFERGRWLEAQALLPYAGLGSFDILDFDNDGNLDFCQLAGGGNWRLNVHSYQQGVFDTGKTYELAPRGSQRYGCPDNTEYGGHYAQQRMFDFDGDGKTDILLNTEHNWRFGYFSLYRNLGNGRFAQEEQLAPLPVPNFPETVPSSNGYALKVNASSLLDYLSLETRDILSPEVGTIEFSYSPDAATVTAPGRVFFSSSFWDMAQWRNGSELYENYRRCKSLEDFLKNNPGFALGQLSDSRIILQVNDKTVITPTPVLLQPQIWTTFTIRWGKQQTAVLMDGAEILSLPLAPTRLAERLHLGSQAWMAMQYAREYPSRRATHPVDFSCPANGAFDYFRFAKEQNQSTLELDFTKEFGPLKNRSLLAYRTAPGVVEYEGNYALIANLGDPNRTRIEGHSWAVLTLVPFLRRQDQPPVFQKAHPLELADGTPFYCHTRTVVVPYDWNHDGVMDIILSSENYPNPCNIGVELFINNGKWQFTRTEAPEIKRLNELLTAHHDVKLVMAKLLSSQEDDFIVWTDPGLRAYRRAFIRQAPVELSVKSLQCR